MHEVSLKATAEAKAERVKDLKVFTGFNLLDCKRKVAEALSLFGRLEIFEEYTAHDISHVDGILQNYNWIIPEETQERMTPADWLVLVLGAYFHDFGLLVTRNEWEARGKTLFERFKSAQQDSESAKDRDYLARVNQLEPERREKFLYQEFVRLHHAERIKSWIVGSPNSQYGYDRNVVDLLSEILSPLHEVFREDLALVCESHNLDDLSNLSKYKVDRPYGSLDEEVANLQYAAIVLRVADLLHIDSDRVPTTAFKLISPTNPVSQLEWTKQRAVRRVRPRKELDADGNVISSSQLNTIEVHARFTDARGFFALDAYLQYAASEITQCHQWAAESNSRFGSKYYFPWLHIDTKNVEAKGFITRQFEFQLDQRRILDLLTGHTLYNDSSVVLRELVQNSIDAVRLQATISEGGYDPTVEIHWSSKKREIVIIDNGVGMSQKVVEDNFLRVGSSLYREPNFVKKNPNFSPISRFGIGVLSTFMVADDVEVTTVSVEEEKARVISLQTVHGQYLVRLLDKSSTELPASITSHGTSLKVTLRPSADLRSILDVLESWIIVPRCKVYYYDHDDESSLPIAVGYESTAQALEAKLVQSGRARRNDSGQLESSSNTVEVRTIDRDGLSHSYAVRWDKWFSEWRFLIAQNNEIYSGPPGYEVNPISSQLSSSCVEGIRVDYGAPGYQISGPIGIVDARGPKAPRTNVARSGFESTPEYSPFLKKVYENLVSHVEVEIEKLRTERGYSITRAGRESSALASDLLGRANFVQASELIDEAMQNVSAIVVEKAGTRSILTLAEIAELGRVENIESPTTRNIEHLLDSVATDKSMDDVLALFEGSGRPRSENSLICSVPEGYFGDAFDRRWSVVEIAASESSPRVRSVWELNASSPLWVGADSVPKSRLLREIQDRTDERLRGSNRRGYPYRVCVEPGKFLAPDLPNFDAVRIANRTYLLPQHLYNNVQMSGEIDAHDRAWFISWLSSSVIRVFSSQAGMKRRSTFDWNQLEIFLNQIGIDEHIGMTQLRALLDDISRIQVFNTSLWERRFAEVEGND